MWKCHTILVFSSCAKVLDKCHMFKDRELSFFFFSLSHECEIPWEDPSRSEALYTFCQSHVSHSYQCMYVCLCVCLSTCIYSMYRYTYCIGICTVYVCMYVCIHMYKCLGIKPLKWQNIINCNRYIDYLLCPRPCVLVLTHLNWSLKCYQERGDTRQMEPSHPLARVWNLHVSDAAAAVGRYENDGLIFL